MKTARLTTNPVLLAHVSEQVASAIPSTGYDLSDGRHIYIRDFTAGRELVWGEIKGRQIFFIGEGDQPHHEQKILLTTHRDVLEYMGYQLSANNIRLTTLRLLCR